MSKLHVTAIGNALVDVLSPTPDALMAELGLEKDTMRLVDAAEAAFLFERMGPGSWISGGSAANTMACMANLGCHVGFIGKTQDDELGRHFAHDLRALGIDFRTQPATDGDGTGRCLIFVTDDGHRTMRTFLGVAGIVEPEDLDAAQIAQSQVFYVEGYQWNNPATKQAIVQGIQVAHRTGNQVAMTLSDEFCVNLWFDEFNQLVRDHVDILFANEKEVLALTRAADFDGALQALRGTCEVLALTRSEKGAVIVRGSEVHVIDAQPIARVVDATGAGDAFAAGFLAGYTQGRSLHDAGVMGTIAAAEVISHMGARPEVDLSTLVAKVLG